MVASASKTDLLGWVLSVREYAPLCHAARWVPLAAKNKGEPCESRLVGTTRHDRCAQIALDLD